TGLFVPLFARAVGDSGRVIAVDIQSSFLDHIKSKATEGGWNNVSVHLGGEREVGLPKDSVDVVFICDTYHHFEYPRTTMASIHQALRPGGDLILIDFHRIPGVSRPWILDHVRASQEVFTQEIVEAGFRLIERKEFLVENYFLRFRREP
ncbi:MAG TPA: class I SAM-dependent methyltransferase, partial [Planctomycetota bacterium]|nr:class I SAM-dependent methyltransferase [Planctomycetota bacterium]